MKGLLIKGMLICFSVALITTANAGNNNNNTMTNHMSKKWICETNASSSSNESDKMADETMSKSPKKGKEAFDFAMKHCRDCTKITCTVEENH